MSKYYLAGPMSGIPQFNYPQFFSVAQSLRAAGYDIISPAEQDTPEKLAEILASTDGDLSKVEAITGTWGDFLSHDVKLVADEVQGLFLLPGWEKSRGAKLEAFVAVLCGHTLTEVDFFQGEMVLSQTTAAYVMGEIYSATK